MSYSSDPVDLVEQLDERRASPGSGAVRGLVEADRMCLWEKKGNPVLESTSQQVAEDSIELMAEQARKVRALYPELFAHLAERDRGLRKLRSRIPHPADPEGFVSFNTCTAVITRIWELPVGIDDLAAGRKR